MLIVQRGLAEELMAVAFDADSLELRSEPVRVLEDVMQALGNGNSGLTTGTAQFAVSDSGTLVYASGGLYQAQTTPLVWVDLAERPNRFPFPRLTFSIHGCRPTARNSRCRAGSSRESSSWPT